LPDSNLELKNMVLSLIFAEGKIIGYFAKLSGSIRSFLVFSWASRLSLIFLS